jgi:hypothetical protein
MYNADGSGFKVWEGILGVPRGDPRFLERISVIRDGCTRLLEQIRIMDFDTM